MTKQLTVLVDGKKVLDIPVHDASVEWNRNLEEIRSNPLLAAAMAGAPAEHLKDLPGEQVAMMSMGSTLEITYRLRFDVEDGFVGEFRPVMG